MTRCEFEPIAQRKNQTLHRCRREKCRLEVWSPYHESEKIHAECGAHVRWRGLGDAVAWLLQAIGLAGWLQNCSCAARQQRLNQLFPFPTRS